MEPETVLEPENDEAQRITEQISLEKQCSAGYTTISVHLPKLESDSADAVRINQELWERGSEYTSTATRMPFWRRAATHGTPHGTATASASW